MYIEDLGGAPADLEDEEEEPEDGRSSKHSLRVNAEHVEKILTRKMERDAAKRPGRNKDMHTEMLRVADIFGATIDGCMKPFRMQATENKNLGASLNAALEHQKMVAEKVRQQQESEMPSESFEPEDKEEEVRLLTEEATLLLQKMDPDVASDGPIAVAKYLVTEATLNRDQRGPVALIANDMHEAWVKQGRPQRMEPVGRILRMLLIGGGGCGK